MPRRPFAGVRGTSFCSFAELLKPRDGPEATLRKVEKASPESSQEAAVAYKGMYPSANAPLNARKAMSRSLLVQT